jgi:cytosine deaminase
MASRLELINVRLPLADETKLYRVTAENGIWTKVERQDSELASETHLPIDSWSFIPGHPSGGAELLDARQRVMLPGLVDAHMHLDKAFSLSRVGNVSGTLEEAVANYSSAAPSFSKEEIRARILRSALQAASFGTSVIRTHLDFHVKAGRDVALRTVEAALEAKEMLAPYIRIQLFPMCPYQQLTAYELEAAEEAIRMGVDGLGGAPHLSQTPEADIDFIFRLAEKYDCQIDLHTDETDDPSVRTLRTIAEKTLQYGFQGRVTVDHLCSLGAMPDADAHKLIGRMAEAQLRAVTLPGANLYLQGRHDKFPVRRGITRVKELLQGGIPIATASDNIHDPFHPFGRGDLLLIGLITAYGAHMGSPSDMRTILRMISDMPAGIVGCNDYGIAAGHPADFVLFDGGSPEELFAMVPERRWIYRAGTWLKTAASRSGWLVPSLAAKWDSAVREISFLPKGTAAAR